MNPKVPSPPTSLPPELKAQTLQVLDKALDLLTNAGWCKGFSRVNSKGQLTWSRDVVPAAFCATGAIVEASYVGSVSKLIDARLEILKRMENIVSPFSIGDWNDAPERTFDEVQALFTRVREGLVAETESV